MTEVDMQIIKQQVKYLGLNTLAENWQKVIKAAMKKRPAYSSFLKDIKDIIEKEYICKSERARLARLKRAKIPEEYILETFPFQKQSRLDRKVVRKLHDSLSFLPDKQDLIFIGPTGCGKTGLATSFLVNAINQGYRGLFVDFSNLIKCLRQSKGYDSDRQLLTKLVTYDALLIDELGYQSCDREQASLFFDLIRSRHGRNTTLITTQLGFEEWGSFLKDVHMTVAMLD